MCMCLPYVLIHEVDLNSYQIFILVYLRAKKSTEKTVSLFKLVAAFTEPLKSKIFLDHRNRLKKLSFKNADTY